MHLWCILLFWCVLKLLIFQRCVSAFKSPAMSRGGHEEKTDRRQGTPTTPTTPITPTTHNTPTHNITSHHTTPHHTTPHHTTQHNTTQHTTQHTTHNTQHTTPHKTMQCNTITIRFWAAGVSHDSPRAREPKHHQKFNEKTPRKREKIVGGRGKKKSAKFWAPRLLPPPSPLRDPTLRGPTLRGPTLRGPTPSGPPLLRASTFFWAHLFFFVHF